jgi:ABC-type glutathione transport system ATPase component
MPDLRVEHLTVEVNRVGKMHPVVKDVSFEIPSGGSVAIVGESGAGKTMIASAIVRLPPSPAVRIAAGKVWFDGVDLLAISEDEMQKVRGRRIAIIFQEASAALNPVMRVGDQIEEGIRLHHGKRGARERALEAMHEVGLDASLYKSYPHQLSGGQRQRVLIASAIAPGPELLIADEPTAALDVTMQAQIIELIARIQKNRGMSLLLITHVLGLVAHWTDFAHVLRRGEIVEGGATREVFKNPQHPYTQTLLRDARAL